MNGRVASALAAVLVAGCGATAMVAARRVTLPRRPRMETAETPSGARVVVLARQTTGYVHASLWIDAGALDASPPGVATVAAWIAETRVGPSAHAEVGPDGTELALDCDARELEACVGALARGLALRAPAEAEVARARQRLEAARARALGDEGRTADRLALAALLGADASPLGRGDQDAEITATRVADFLSASYGPTRALVVVAGDVERALAISAISDALAAAPRASTARASRERAGAATDAVAVEVGSRSMVTVAARADSLGQAGDAAEALARAGSLARIGEVSAAAFELRAGPVLLVRIAGARRLEDAARTAALEVERALGSAHEAGARDVAVARDADEPRAAARRAGLAWVAERGPPIVVASPREIALGAVVAGGRGDDLRARDPDARLRDRTLASLVAARDAALAAAHPALTGEISETSASVTAPNGARLEVRRRAGDQRVAIAVRFRGGAASDPASIAGRTALLATAAATGCEGLPADALTERLRLLDARIEPAVDASSWGVAADAPRERFADLAELVLCGALTPALDAGDLARARMALRARLRQPGSLDALRALVAPAIAPTAPGTVAPLGTADGVSDASLADVRRALAASRTGVRASVVVIGDVPPRDALDRLAWRVADLERGTEPDPISAASAASSDVLASTDPERTRVAVAFRAPSTANGDQARDTLRSAADALAGALARTPGDAPTASDGDAAGGVAWMAVALDVREDALESLPAAVAAARDALLGSASLTPQLVDARARAERERARLTAEPLYAADSLARELAGPPRSPSTAEALEPLARSVLHAAPVWVVSRPRRSLLH